MGSIRDVTAKLHLEDQLAQTQKMETIGILAGGLAHDFNNILGGIVGTLSILKYEINEETQWDLKSINKDLDMMERASRQAADMVKQLLTLSRKNETEFVSTDLNLTLQNVKKICESTFDKSIELNFQVPQPRSMAYADPIQMEQVLLNLCINANHAMTLMRPSGMAKGGRLSVSLERFQADSDFCASRPEAREIDYWRISVGDSGIGIDPQIMSKIFIPFFTTKEKGKGTGLGLAMVYSIVQKHEGFINLYSEVGHGSTFNVYIPVLQDAEFMEEENKSARLPRGEGLILVVDDE
jgi:signal transduction histidine kinase